MGTLSSSLCQTLNKGTVDLIPVIGLWLLTDGLGEDRGQIGVLKEVKREKRRGSISQEVG